MNPEFQRNVWLELTPVRIAVMVAVLALAFFAAAITTDMFAGPGGVARVAYYVIVVLWGTRNAARSVVGEIRERTWDGQRLSSLSAGTMMWGKLFGSTIFNWLGGALCLIVIMAETVDRAGIAQAALELVFYLAIGVIAQAVSLLSSLVAVGRRHARTQFEVFLYQAAGIVAAGIVGAIADPTKPSLGSFVRADTIAWWGLHLNAEMFLLVSLAAFSGWTLMGCYQQMRLELKLRNGPFVWLAFLVFMACYVAGFDGIALVPRQSETVAWRLLLGGITCGVLGYVMAILEPKGRVQIRWLASEFGKFHIGTALANMQGWMMAYWAALFLGIALIVRLGLTSQIQDQAFIGAMLGFFTRDMAIIVWMSMLTRRRGGDFLAVAVLVLLYFLMPSILAGLHYALGQALFVPRVTEPFWLSPAAAWAEAIVAWAVTVTKLALPEDRAKEG